MTEKQINEKARKLVKTSIELHKKKLLGKITLLDFFKEHLKDLYDSKYYNRIIIKYCSLLAQAGYEIMIDTDYFNIINYDSYEYQLYTEKLLSKRPKNYDELQREAKIIAQKIITLYKSKTYIDKSFQDYLNYTIPKSKYNNHERIIIEVNAVSHLTHKHYDIDNTNPLVLSKFI